MMKYDLNRTFLDLEGNTVMDGPKETEKPATLRSLLTLACLNADTQKYADGESKHKIYKLLRRVSSKADELEISAEDVVLLKSLVGHVFNVYIVGIVYDALEGDSSA